MRVKRIGNKIGKENSKEPAYKGQSSFWRYLIIILEDNEETLASFKEQGVISMPCPTWNLIFFPHSPSLPNNQNHHILKILITMSFLSLYHPLHLYSYQSSSDSFCTIFINGPSVDALVIYCCIINYSKT